MLTATILLSSQHVIGQTGEHCLQPLRDACDAGHSFHLVTHMPLPWSLMAMYSSSAFACRAMGCPQQNIVENRGIFAFNLANQLGHRINLHLIKAGET